MADLLRILVCGGRDFDNMNAVNKRLAEFEDRVAVVIQGGARGADYLGKLWAERRGLPVIEMRPNWNRHGKRAGSLRNQWMLDHAKPDLVVAFPGGYGTADMVRRATEAGIPVHPD